MPGSLPRFVSARTHKQLSWQVYFSIFVHAASSLVFPFSNWLFLPLPLFLPCVFSCLPFPNFSAGFQWLHYPTSLPRAALGDFSLGLEKALMLMEHIWTVREHFLMMILTCQSRTPRAVDVFKHLWFNSGKTKAVKREISC